MSASEMSTALSVGADDCRRMADGRGVLKSFNLSPTPIVH